ncbi:MAG TPA: MotA/TolQ/ExbB proton channel family protein [Candidatus Desulfobacillus denitrificans]|jgi:biopolymer transport protein ExbB|nr:MotA/TolQ/ExbB proton channel family protein [Rhodocyclaceae bacterium]HNQ57631.1 MotA/TolQ/ExbB proton channel family protein [Candidatus Desulfobacillus denitrificans]HNT61718.1 MotA/TolQ/ExbB proton channel family protein [Candidatus Desulfobacillus denitrificans]
METSLGFAHFLASTDGVARVVLGLMLVMSVGTWYLIVAKGAQAFFSLKRSREFLGAFWKAPNLDAVAHRLRERGVNEPFSHLVHHGFTAIEQHRAGRDGSRGLIDAGTPDEFLTRALKRAIVQDKSRLEYGQTFLATVASSAPFVGLFGTVWGIYHALMAIGMSGQGTLDKVAGPVGEALIMTAIGLAVAIPAAVAHNAFARANRNILAELDSFAHDVFAFLATGLKAAPQDGDVAATSERILARVATRSA